VAQHTLPVPQSLSLSHPTASTQSWVLAAHLNVSDASEPPQHFSPAATLQLMAPQATVETGRGHDGLCAPASVAQSIGPPAAPVPPVAAAPPAAWPPPLTDASPDPASVAPPEEEDAPPAASFPPSPPPPMFGFPPAPFVEPPVPGPPEPGSPPLAPPPIPPAARLEAPPELTLDVPIGAVSAMCRKSASAELLPHATESTAATAKRDL
jgi:hypothetical protein